MLFTDAEKLLDYCEKTSYKNTKVLVTPKNQEAEKFIKKNYFALPDLMKVCDAVLHEDREYKHYLLTDPDKIKNLYKNFPSDLFEYEMEEHPEFI